MTFPWLPMYDVVFIDRDSIVNEEGKLGSIVIPEFAQDKDGRLAQSSGTVLAVGQGRLLQNGRLAPLIVQPGDRVLYGRFAGQDLEIPVGGTRVKVYTIKEGDIRAVQPANREMYEETIAAMREAP